MKTLLLIVALLGSTVTAGEASCPYVGELAVTVMKARQLNISMSRVMSAAENIKEPSTKKLFKAMAIDAYSMNSYVTEVHQKMAIAEFKNKHLLACYIKKRK